MKHSITKILVKQVGGYNYVAVIINIVVSSTYCIGQNVHRLQTVFVDFKFTIRPLVSYFSFDVL